MNSLNENLDLPIDTLKQDDNFSLDFDIINKLKKKFNCLEQSLKGNNFELGNFSEYSEQNYFIFDNDPQQNKYSEHELSEKKNTPKFTTKKKKNKKKKNTKNKKLKTHKKYD